MNSIWLEIPNYPNYRISPEGKILSIRYQGISRCKMINPFITHNGYERVLLYNKEGGGTNKLKEADVLDIRARILSGEQQKKIAIEYNVSPSTILKIKKRIIWAHV